MDLLLTQKYDVLRCILAVIISLLPHEPQLEGICFA